MSDEIVPYRPALSTARKQRSAPEQVAIILAPLFALFGVEEKAIQRIYVERLIDIAPDALQTAVDKAIDSCKFRPTVAELREFAGGNGEPGPRNDLTQEQIAARPSPGYQLYRDPEDTPAGRRERLRRTEKWGNRYGH